MYPSFSSSWSAASSVTILHSLNCTLFCERNSFTLSQKIQPGWLYKTTFLLIQVSLSQTGELRLCWHATPVHILNGTKGTQRSEHGDSALGERIERLERENALLKAA